MKKNKKQTIEQKKKRREKQNSQFYAYIVLKNS
jgi:hypothetical protein